MLQKFSIPKKCYSSKNTGYTITIFKKNKNTKYFLSSTYEKDRVTVKI